MTGDIFALLLLGVVTSVAQGRLNGLEFGLTLVSAIMFIGLVARWGGKTNGEMTLMGGCIPWR